MNNYKYSKEGMEHLILWEDLLLPAYVAPEGQWSIGVGCTYIPAGFSIYVNNKLVKIKENTSVTEDMRLQSKEQAIEISSQLIDNKYGKAVNDMVKVRITQSMYDALVSFTYNVGVGGLQQSSVLRHLNNADYEMAAVSFMMWNKHYDPKQGKMDNSDGLINRRMSEMHLFIKGFNNIVNKKSKYRTNNGFCGPMFT